MCILEFVRRAENNEPIFITEFSSGMEKLSQKHYLELIDVLAGNKESRFLIALPITAPASEAETDMLEDYLAAKIYNTLSALGGLRIILRYDAKIEWLKDTLKRVTDRFEVSSDRASRKGYGRCINVIDRMMDHITSGDSANTDGFEFLIEPVEGHKPAITNSLEAVSKPSSDQQVNMNIISSLYLKAANDLDNKVLLGIDIGGSDIKLACSIGNKLSACKEFDWFPAEYSEAKQIIDPVVLLVRLMRVYATSSLLTENLVKTIDQSLTARIRQALDQHISIAELTKIVTEAENSLADELISFDALGMCFPDVVINNKIAGGETFKTRGIRANPVVDYEAEMHILADLNDRLAQYCNSDVIGIINDGPMAAYTAAVELVCSGQKAMAAEGIFAHTLGTELGTGWVDEHGQIPDIPLEVYNFVIDLGSYPARKYQADDPRSINNFNTGIPGTLQKYTSQSGAFRLAIEAARSNSDILDNLVALGFLTVDKEADTIKINNEPTDMRKPFLQYLMDQASNGNNQVYEDIFIEIGRYMAVTWHETMDILRPLTNARPLFGRLVKNEKCFDLMKTGASHMAPNQVLLAADDGMAASPLMLQLSQSESYTVAQFAQAIGAIHYANQLLIN